MRERAFLRAAPSGVGAVEAFPGLHLFPETLNRFLSKVGGEVGGRETAGEKPLHLLRPLLDFFQSDFHPLSIHFHDG